MMTGEIRYFSNEEERMKFWREEVGQPPKIRDYKPSGCKYCTEYEDLPEHIINGESIGRIFDTCIQTDENGLWHIELPSGLDIGIRYCPYCGRKLEVIE